MLFLFKSKRFIFFLNYLQAEVFHKPLVPQEIARHVRVSIIDQRPQTQRQQLQVNLLHRLIEHCVPIANDITAEKAKGIISSACCHVSALTTLLMCIPAYVPQWQRIWYV